jgi:predicted DNA-binding protein (MmcQ/YjbR family)
MSKVEGRRTSAGPFFGRCTAMKKRAPKAPLSMNPPTIRPDRLKRLRQICLCLPDTTEKVAWGDPTWRVRDRIFCMQKGNTRTSRPSVWVKGAEGVQAVLVDSEPDVFFVPPYVGNQGWIGIYMDGGRLDWGRITDLIEESHGLSARRPR